MNPKARSALHLFLLLNFVEGLGALVYLFNIPGEGGALFGFSPARLALAVALLLATLVFLGLYSASWRAHPRLLQFLAWLDRLMARPAAFWLGNLLLLIVAGAACYLVTLGPTMTDRQYQAYIVRLSPPLAWAGLIALQTNVLTFTRYYRLHRAGLRAFVLHIIFGHLLFYMLIPIGAVFAIYLVYKLTHPNYIFVVPEYERFFWYYLIQAAIPLTYLFVYSKARVNGEIKTVLEKLWHKFKAHWKLFLLVWLVFAALYLYLGYNTVPTLNARALRFLEDEPPYIPIEPMLGMLLSFELNWVVPPELVSPLIGLFAFTLLYLFFIYVNEEGGGIIPLTMLYVFTNGWLVYFSLFGNIELIPAVFGFLGLFAIMRRRYSLGAILLMAGVMIKASALFFVIAAALVIVYHVIRDRRTLKQLNYIVILIAAFYAVWALYGIYLYIYEGRGSASYLFTSQGYIFWITPTIHWLEQYFSRYIYLSVIGLLAIFYKGKYRNTALFLFALVFVVRSISRLWGGYYFLFNIPQLAFLTFLGLSFLYRKISRLSSYAKWAAIGGLVIVSVTQGIIGFEVYNSTINRINSNLVELVTQMADELPRGATVAQRRISLQVYFDRLGRNDIEYYRYSENRERTWEGLQQAGCVVLLSLQDDLEITDEQLKTIGYKEIYDLKDETGAWRLWLKDCE
jgi:hypothetical protein